MEYFRSDIVPNSTDYVNGLYTWMSVRAGGADSQFAAMRMNEKPMDGEANQEAYMRYDVHSASTEVTNLLAVNAYYPILMNNGSNFLKGAIQSNDPSASLSTSTMNNQIVPFMNIAQPNTTTYLGFDINNVDADSILRLPSRSVKFALNMGGFISRASGTAGGSPVTLQIRAFLGDDTTPQALEFLGNYEETFLSVPEDNGTQASRLTFDTNIIFYLPKLDIQNLDASATKKIRVEARADQASVQIRVVDLTTTCEFGVAKIPVSSL